MRKNPLTLLTLIFLVICKGSPPPPSSDARVSLTNNPLTRYISEIGFFKILISQYPRLNSMIQQLSNIEESMRNLSIEFKGTNSAMELLSAALKSMLDKYQQVDPTKAEKEILENLKNIDKRIAHIKESYGYFRKVSSEFSYSQISDDSGNHFRELDLQIAELENRMTTCSSQRIQFAVDLDRAWVQNNFTLMRLQGLEEAIQTRKMLIHNNNRRNEDLLNELREDLKQIKTETKIIEDSYRNDFLRQKDAAIEACDKRVQRIDARLSELETLVGELGTAMINHFIIVIDHSGSMQGEKWKEALRSLEYFMKSNQQQGSHTISIIPFESSAHIHMKNQRFFEYTSPENYPWGRTNFDAAAEAIRDTIPLSKARPVVLFLTDGEPTESTRMNSILDEIHAKHGQKGLMFFGLGVGTFNYGILSELTKKANAGHEDFANEKGKIQFLHTTHDEKVLHKIFLEVSGIVKKSGEEIDEEISRLRKQKTIEFQELANLIKSLEEFYHQSTGENSLLNQKEQKLVESYERKKSEIEKRNDKLELDISSLISEKDGIPISTTKVNDLYQRHALQIQECSQILDKISEIKAKREALTNDSNHEIGVLTQRDLIKRSEELMVFDRNFHNFIESYINNLEIQKLKIEGCLERNSFANLRSHYKKNADFFVSKFFNLSEGSSCQGVSGCLKTIWTERNGNREFDSQLPLSELLTIISDHLDSFSSLIADESQPQNPFNLEDLESTLRRALLTKRKGSLSILSVIDWLTKWFWEARQDLHLNAEKFKKVGKGEIQDEFRILEIILRLIIRDLNMEYQRFSSDSWKGNLEDINNLFKEMLSGAEKATGLSSITK